MGLCEGRAEVPFFVLGKVAPLLPHRCPRKAGCLVQAFDVFLEGLRLSEAHLHVDLDTLHEACDGLQDLFEVLQNVVLPRGEGFGWPSPARVLNKEEA